MSDANPNASVLVGKNQEELDHEDQLLSALSNLAYSVEEVPNPENAKRGNAPVRTSRFWFRLETTSEMVAARKKKLAPKSVEHIDSEITDRLKTYEKELSPVLKDRIAQVREFFLTEIAPLTLATAGGAIQSRAVAERMLDTEVDSAIFARFENMVNRAATIKLGIFVLDYFGLPLTHFNDLVGATPHRGNSELSQVLEAINANNHFLRKLPTTSDLKSAVKNDGNK